MFHDFEIDSIERALESCPEERINDDIVTMLCSGNPFPIGYGFAFSESQRRRSCLRARLETREPARNLEVRARISFCLVRATEENNFNTRAIEPELAGKGCSVAAI